MKLLLTKKRAGEMYAFLIGTIIGLLIIGAMFFGYGIYKSGTSNSQIFTAVQNGDLNKLSSLRLNNKIPVNTDKIVVFKRGDNTVDLSTLTDTGSAYAYVVSNDSAVSEGVITKQDFFALDDEKIISKGFITPGSSTDRIPKYFGVPNSSTISGFTVYETSDTAYFSNSVVSTPQTPQHIGISLIDNPYVNHFAIWDNITGPVQLSINNPSSSPVTYTIYDSGINGSISSFNPSLGSFSYTSNPMGSSDDINFSVTDGTTTLNSTFYMQVINDCTNLGTENECNNVIGGGCSWNAGMGMCDWG